MNYTRASFPTAVAAVLYLTPHDGSAATTFDEIIPASACQLEFTDDAGKADLVDGSWLIGATVANDQVELLCPLRIPFFFVVGATKTILRWSSIQLFYRDPDGQSTAHSVTASLLRIGRLNPSPTTLHVFSSNTFLATTDTGGTELLTTVDLPLIDAQHFVRVVMKQGSNNGTNRVRFTRVRFFPDPPNL